MKKILSMIFLSSLLLTACVSNNKFFNNENEVVVAVEQSSYYQIKSANPLKLNRGENARFKLDFNEEYGYKDSSNGYFENGYLRVDNVQYSETISVKCVEFVLVSLEVAANCHYKVISENPVRVEKGTDASFEIEFEDGYVFESSSNGYMKDNLFIINNVENSQSVSMLAKPKGNIHVKVIIEKDFGTVRINGIEKEDDYGLYNDVFQLDILPCDDYKFVCWSVDDYISKTMPYSFEREMSLTLKDDITLYVNFWNNDKNTIIYNGNGGATNSGDENIYYPHRKGNHIRINTIQGSKAFRKEGYLLESWNTAQDGSGEKIGLGSRIKIEDENVPQVLYAQWIQETNNELFEYVLLENGYYKVINCTSEDDIVVIPEKIDGIPVYSVSSNAFVNLPFSTLYLPQWLKEVESGAIIDCVNFDNIHYFDYLDTIPNNFCNNGNPSCLYINANTDPCYIGSYQNAFVRKIDSLLECDDSKIVIIGNSNTMYSIDGSMLANEFNSDVVCLGVQYGVGVAWELACLRDYCKNDKNIVVFCCEFNAATIGPFSEHKYYAAEGNYDLLLSINFKELKYTNVFGAYCDFKNYKKTADVTCYAKDDYGCDLYGCLKVNREPSNSDEWASSMISVDLNFYTDGKFLWIENYCSSFTDSQFYISCCSFNKNSIDTAIRDQFYSSYQQSIVDCCSYDVISCLEDYAFKGSAFFNDNYHLLYQFTVERTNKLINDMRLNINAFNN